MPTIWGQRHGATFVPYAKFMDALDDIPEGVRLKLVIDKDRNGKFNALFHVLLDRVAKAVNRGPAKTDIDTLKAWVKLKRGWFDLVLLPMPVDGQTHAIGFRSTSFAKMGEVEFHQFAAQTCDLIRDELAPWIASSREWAEIRQIIDGIAPQQTPAQERPDKPRSIA